MIAGRFSGPFRLRKFGSGRIRAQVNPQDMLSIDQVIWTKAPMIPEMEMDWLIVVGENLLYGPTTAEALLEFEKLGEINPLHRANQLQHRLQQHFGRNAVSSSFPGGSFSGKATCHECVCRLRFSRPPKAEVFASIFNSVSASSRMRFSTRVASSRLPRKPSSVSKAKYGELEDRIRDYSGFRGS